MIRPLTHDDALIIASIHKRSFETAWPVSDMEGHITKDIALGWEAADRLAGFIIIQVVQDQSEILTVAVDKAFQNNGAGRKIVRAGEEAARQAGADIVFLEVAEDNGAAIALYKNCGYESFGRRPGYYKREGGRVAARLFRKNLN